MGLAFSRQKGVVSTRAGGYAGGSFPNFSYRDVCSGVTRRAECVEVAFDPKQITFKNLLEVFWRMHDYTSLNRQGLDEGSNYRSAIFFTSLAQEKQALASKKRLEKTRAFAKLIVTQIVELKKFYPAGECH